MTRQEALKLKPGDMVRAKGWYHAPAEIVTGIEHSTRRGREVVYIYTKENTYRHTQALIVKEGAKA